MSGSSDRVQAEDGQEQVRVVFDLPEGGGDGS
jgi:hypothetical protein